jgi:hypothetical protein
MSLADTTQKTSAPEPSISNRLVNRRNVRAPAGKHLARQAVEALLMLGYPIGRYLRDTAVEEGFANNLPKIYARMRISFYQNRSEFLRLKLLLQSRLEGVEMNVLRSMAEHAADFSPMWVDRVRAEGALGVLEELRGME